MNNTIKNRYEFVLLFDVENGNPNGDPDAGNMPRMDAETGLGLVTDGCLKRKIRNYVDIVRGGEQGYDIYVQEGVPLNAQHRKAYEAYEMVPEPKKLPKAVEEAQKITRFMCSHFFDIRTFGAVMTTEVNCGQVRGPVQINFARSIDPIVQQEVSITRVTVTSENADKDREMGRKYIVPYGLYRVEGYVSAHLANKSGFTEEDLELIWDSLINMFDHDRSAARGKMSARKLVIFKHESALGNAPANQLFDLIKVSKNDLDRPARSYQDYEVTVNHSALPRGVSLIER